MMPTLEQLLQTAREAATIGAQHALRHIARRRETISTYAHDVKLALDVECQREIESFIRQRFPDHAFLGEEDETELQGRRITDTRRETTCAEDATLQWVVDPIDGTVNFSNGLPIWCSSVAVRLQDRVLAGAVYAPMLDALYSATADGPAYLNDTPIHVSSCDTLGNAIVMTGMDRECGPGIQPLTCFRSIATACRKARIAGSAAIDLCWVAQGAAEGYFESSIYLWDIAAAGLIVERAGGRTEVLTHRKIPHQVSFLATNGHLHDKVKDILPLQGMIRQEAGASR